jgi:hypothetical protein
LSIQEVAHWDEVTILVGVDRGVLEDLAGVRLWANAHVFLAKVPDLSVEASVLLWDVLAI